MSVNRNNVHTSKMRIYGGIEVQYFAYLFIILYDYKMMHLNFREHHVV